MVLAGGSLINFPRFQYSYRAPFQKIVQGLIGFKWVLVVFRFLFFCFSFSYRAPFGSVSEIAGAPGFPEPGGSTRDPSARLIGFNRALMGF